MSGVLGTSPDRDASGSGRSESAGTRERARWLPTAVVASVLALVVAGSVAGCAPAAEEEGASEDTTAVEDTVPQRPIQQVMGEYGNRWMVRPEVTGMGIGRCEGEPCIVVYLARELSDDAEPFPERVEGHRVRTEVVGRVVPRSGDPPEEGSGGG
ncbi:MAG: hypothetical protein ACOC9H_02995 [Gemmatimonadota bacterium]